LRRFEQRFPGLVDRICDRPDLQIPAVGSSFLFHAFVLFCLGLVVVNAHSTTESNLRGAISPYRLEDFRELDKQSLADIDNTRLEPVAGSFGPTIGATIVEAPPSQKGLPRQDLALNAPNVARLGSLILPQANILDQRVSIQGTGAEFTGNVEGAVDRIAVEILRRLEKGRTHVIWAFDSSGSLYYERQRLVDYIDKIYEHIEAFDRDRRAADGGLLSSVYAFGQNRRMLTSSPTDDRSELRQAIQSVPLDESGIESTFAAVGEIANRLGRFRKDGAAYQSMTIVVTDEVGDDEELLEDAILAARAAKMPVFVLGSPALFARVEGFMPYTDPKTKQHYPAVPVRQGPESATLETLHLPFWYDGDQFDMLDSGFGPFALSRLASETGGIYFITRIHQNRIFFDPANMREYRPDWESKERYLAELNRNPLRQAVMRAAQISQQRLPGMPSFNFPSIETAEFKEAMARNQEVVSLVQYTVDEALQAIAPGASRRDHETARRWQAHYDLARGRLLAMHVRCIEFNLACGRMKKDPPKFKQPNSNAWRLVPDTELSLKDKSTKAMADEAVRLLERVVQDHPGTPWAMLASREIKDPLGLKWVETHVPPPRPRGESNAMPPRNQNRPMGNSKPPQLPKL
jgi:hypothetical protein